MALPLIGLIIAGVSSLIKAATIGAATGAAAYGVTKLLDVAIKSEPASPTKEDDPPGKTAIGLAGTQTKVGEVVAQAPENTPLASVAAAPPDAPAEFATRAALAPRTAFAVPAPRETLAEHAPHVEAESLGAPAASSATVLATVSPVIPLTSLPI